MNNISVIGCGGHARSVADTLIKLDEDLEISFYDKKAQPNEKIFGIHNVYLLDNNAQLISKNLFVAIGNNLERKRWVDYYSENKEVEFVSIISNSANTSKFATIKKGCFIGEYTHIGPEATIGAFSIVNTGAIIEHEVNIGEFCHISVNSTVCGRCKIRDRVFVGAGAVIKDNISICDDVVIGAGGVVCHDITEPGIYVGCPVRKIK